MQKTLNIGVIGSGAISTAHFEAIDKVDTLKLMGVASKSIEDANEIAEKQGCKVYDDAIHLIEDPAIEVVILLTPPGVHHDFILRSIQNEKHLIVEKPLGVSLEHIDQYIQYAQKVGVTLSVISQHRFDEASSFIRKKIDQSLLGDIKGGSCEVLWYREQDYYNEWRKKKTLSGGGVLAIQAIHTIDLMLWYLGDVKGVKAYTGTTGHTDIDVEDIAAACIEFEEGKLATINATTTAYPGYPARLTLFGKDGSVTLASDEIQYYQSRHEQESYKANGDVNQTVDGPAAVSVSSFVKQYKDIYKAIQNGESPLVSGEEARKAYALIDAIYQSAHTGREIRL
ncbi:Gfo/Idh/MocA family oxidoreductase [Salicibibacter cibarius]|uniref:Gfo/Idh/MocA family oxidoreductase n=1 Tax=Salicibibacter cibarius TaxID=2743000 RepID=A0A7T7CB03_9BACI|nr:Gfo/Idh/MocA family oxidoreductase [Salicibibacter cibarius]QQK75378.1 Gfo/Idh/MocA family oxidoreductase [Salicibibacter cibarius]